MLECQQSINRSLHLNLKTSSTNIEYLLLKILLHTDLYRIFIIFFFLESMYMLMILMKEKSLIQISYQVQNNTCHLKSLQLKKLMIFLKNAYNTKRCIFLMVHQPIVKELKTFFIIIVLQMIKVR